MRRGIRLMCDKKVFFVNKCIYKVGDSIGNMNDGAIYVASVSLLCDCDGSSTSSQRVVWL